MQFLEGWPMAKEWKCPTCKQWVPEAYHAHMHAAFIRDRVQKWEPPVVTGKFEYWDTVRKQNDEVREAP